MIQIGTYIATLVIGGIENTSLLASNPQTLEDMGQKDPYKMRYDYQI